MPGIDHEENYAEVPKITPDQDTFLDVADKEVNAHLKERLEDYEKHIEFLTERWEQELPEMAGFIRHIKGALMKGQTMVSGYQLRDLLYVAPDRQKLTVEQSEVAFMYLSLILLEVPSYPIELKMLSSSVKKRPIDSTPPSTEVPTGML